MFRIDLAALTGFGVTVYGQQEVMRDLFDAAERVDWKLCSRPKTWPCMM